MQWLSKQQAARQLRAAWNAQPATPVVLGTKHLKRSITTAHLVVAHAQGVGQAALDRLPL